MRLNRDTPDPLNAARDKKSHFVTQLVGAGVAKPRDIAIAAATEFGVPLFDLDALPIDRDVDKIRCGW